MVSKPLNKPTMKVFTIKCADCPNKKVFSARTISGIYDKARDEGWAIDRNNLNKWCPNCAPLHRHVGRRGAARTFVQIKLDI